MAGLVLALVVPVAPAEAAAPTITISRGSVIGGESIKVFGNTRVRKARPVVLQRKAGKRWVNMVRSRTTRAGAYKFYWKPPTRAGSRTVIRVVAPQVKIKRKKYRRLITGGRTVLTVRQTASMTLPDFATAGAQVTVTGKFTPARPGRRVVLQKPAGGTWVSTGITGTETSSGAVTLRGAFNDHGSYQLRLIALPANGAPAYASAAENFDVSLPAPTGIQAALQGGTSATVSWNPVSSSGAAYRVYRRTDPSNDAAGWGQPVAVTSGSQYTVGSLAPATTYYFTVTAFVGDDESAFPAKTSVTTPAAPVDTTAPAVPSGVQATSGADSQSVVTWNPVGDADLAGYRVYRKTAATSWVLAGSTAKGVTTFTATGLSNGTTYTFAVTSVDDAPSPNESDKSATATGTPQGPPDTTPPATPTGVGATGANTSALVGWSGVTDGDLAGYRVYVGSSASGPWTEATTSLVPVGTTTFNVTGLSNGTTYWFTVTSEDETGNESAKALAASATPTAAAKTWSQVSAGGQHTCAVRSDGTLWCWGRNGEGQLGSAADIAQTSPAQVGTGSSWASVSAGQDFTCAVQTSGTLWCWGQNSYGQIGSGGGIGSQTQTPTQVGSATDWVSVSAGASSACAVKTTGALWCWGLNSDGQLGRTTAFTLDPVAPGAVAGTTWAQVAVGTDSACATRTDHTLWCWGSNLYGQLGVATNVDSSNPNPTPLQVTGSTWAQVSVGGYHACAVKADNTLWCWGRNEYGELGKTANATSNAAPTQVAGTTWSQVSAGGDHTCAVRTIGTAACWGANAFGQLATSTSTSSTPTPTSVPGNTWESIEAGLGDADNAASGHTAGRTTSGGVSTWGWNSSGQLGTATNAGTSNPTTTPVVVAVP